MNKKNIILLVAMVFGLMGCEDFLIEDPKGEPTNANFWKSEQDVNAATTALYIFNNFQGIYGRGINLYSLIASDDFVVGKAKGQIEDIKNFKTSGNGSYTRDIWPMHFQVIKRANDILRNVPGMTISEESKKNALGQAYFMRGLAYFQLSLLYGDDSSGGIPIVDETVTEDFFITRPESVTTSYEFAALSFEKAAEHLAYFDADNTESLGRPHKNAALAYLARTHLHNAEFDAASWQKVVDACDEVIDSGKNSLETNFEDAFKIANNWGSEYLWSVPSNTLGGSMFSGSALENKAWGKYNGWGYFAPTLGLYESYEAGDKRRDATLLAFGDEFEFFEATRKYASIVNLTGFQLKKYLEPFAYGLTHLNPNGDHPSTDLNLPLLRYSHVLLMKAEALIQMNGAGAGDAEINLIRARAGLTAKIGATMDDLKAERRAEFAGELFGRYEDLCRWGDAVEIQKALSGKPHQEIVFDDDENSNNFGFPVLSTDFTQVFPTVEVWRERDNFVLDTHRVWPIPTNVIDSSEGTLTQNKGW